MGEEQQQPAQPAPAAPPANNTKSGGSKTLLIVIIILIIVLAGGYVAYAKLIKKASSFSQILNPASTLKLNPNCRYNDPDLCKFMNNWKDVKYMTMTSESTDKDGTKSTLRMKTVGDDKTQMITEQGGKESYNYITIGNTSYTKDYTDNKWFKYTTSPENDLVKTEESKIDFDIDDPADKTTYKKIGKEACGKYTCFKYQVIDPSFTDITQYLYFDDKEYMLRKTRTEVKDGAVDEATFDYSSVSISEPSPVKEGNPYDISANAALPATTSTPASSSTTPSSSSSSSSSAAAEQWLNDLQNQAASQEIPVDDSVPADYGETTELPAE